MGLTFQVEQYKAHSNATLMVREEGSECPLLSPS